MKSRAGFLLVLLLCVQPARASNNHVGFEVGGSFYNFDHLSNQRPGEQLDSRFLPAIGVILEHPLGANWSVVPALRYTQAGEKTSWAFPPYTGGTEEARERTLSGGIGLQHKLLRAIIISISPELSYLLAGSVKGDQWNANQNTVDFNDDYAERSDRWNAVVRAGAGTAWRMGEGLVTANVRYARAINSMTRVAEAHPSQAQQNIAWTQTPVFYSSEYRLRGLEVVMGYSW